MILVPLTAPHFYLLLIVKMGIQISLQAPNCQPLVTDYVKKHSRGRATAFLAFGLVVGDLISFAVLMQYTKRFSPEVGFLIVALCVLAIGTILLKLIKEPNIQKVTSSTNDKRNLKFHKMTLIEKMQVLTREVIQESRTNPIIPLCYAGVFVIKLVLILINTFVVLWVSSFIKGKGVQPPEFEIFEDDKDAKSVI